MEFKGTPGPWRFNDSIGPVVTASRIGIQEGSKGICSLSELGKTTDEIHHNARLIAASKQLLEAAIDFVNKVDEGRARSTDSYNKFKRAIESALGEE